MVAQCCAPWFGLVVFFNFDGKRNHLEDGIKRYIPLHPPSIISCYWYLVSVFITPSSKILSDSTEALPAYKTGMAFHHGYLSRYASIPPHSSLLACFILCVIYPLVNCYNFRCLASMFTSASHEVPFRTWQRAHVLCWQQMNDRPNGKQIGCKQVLNPISIVNYRIRTAWACFALNSKRAVWLHPRSAAILIFNLSK